MIMKTKRKIDTIDKKILINLLRCFGKTLFKISTLSILSSLKFMAIPIKVIQIIKKIVSSLDQLIGDFITYLAKTENKVMAKIANIHKHPMITSAFFSMFIILSINNPTKSKSSFRILLKMY